MVAALFVVGIVVIVLRQKLSEIATPRGTSQQQQSEKAALMVSEKQQLTEYFSRDPCPSPPRLRPPRRDMHKDKDKNKDFDLKTQTDLAFFWQQMFDDTLTTRH